jgi:hypothetical protein
MSSHNVNLIFLIVLLIKFPHICLLFIEFFVYRFPLCLHGDLFSKVCPVLLLPFFKDYDLLLIIHSCSCFFLDLICLNHLIFLQISVVSIDKHSISTLPLESLGSLLSFLINFFSIFLLSIKEMKIAELH